MGRILTALLAFHWMAVFAVAAATALTGGGTFSPMAQPAAAALCLGNVLVAALFLWMLVTALGRDAAAGDGEQVVRLAFCGAVIMLTATLAAGGTAPAMKLAALMASYLVVRYDRSAGEAADPQSEEQARAAARLMALGAAHGVMLARRGGPGVPANDEWRR